MSRAGLLAAVLALWASLCAAKPAPGVRVLGVRGGLRLYRLETEPWPLLKGAQLPRDCRLELDRGARLRLRYADYLDFDVQGPARLEVYEIPAPGGGEGAGRIVVRLDRGWLLVDGRFRFGRPADVVLGAPDRSLRLPAAPRFFLGVSGGRSSFYLPLTASAGTVRASIHGGALEACTFTAGAGAGPPPSLLRELVRPVPVFVLVRDYDQDLGQWPRPPVLGPLLTERLAAQPGLEVLEGSGDTRVAYRANAALKKGQDDYLRQLALARGARWVVVGNCVSDTPPQEGEPFSRRVRGQAEVRLLETAAGPDGLELVSESSVTLVARAGRPIEQASRQAMEAAGDAVCRYMLWHIQDLLQGRAHAGALIRFKARAVGKGALLDLRSMFEAMDSVQRVFRRGYADGTVRFDLVLRKSASVFDAQWAAAAAADRSRRWRSLPAVATDSRFVEARPLPSGPR